MYNNNISKAMDKYLKKISLKSALLSERNRKTINAFLLCFDKYSYDYLAKRKKLNEIYNTLWTGKENIAGCFSGSEYEVLETLLAR